MVQKEFLSTYFGIYSNKNQMDMVKCGEWGDWGQENASLEVEEFSTHAVSSIRINSRYIPSKGICCFDVYDIVVSRGV